MKRDRFTRVAISKIRKGNSRDNFSAYMTNIECLHLIDLKIITSDYKEEYNREHKKNGLVRRGWYYFNVLDEQIRKDLDSR